MWNPNIRCPYCGRMMSRIINREFGSGYYECFYCGCCINDEDIPDPKYDEETDDEIH